MVNYINKELILKLRSWFRMNGQMDFEINGEGKGEFITYKCQDIENIFKEIINASCPCGLVSDTKECDCPDDFFTD